MKAITLTAAQKTQAQVLKASLVSAQSVFIAARKSLNAYLHTLSGKSTSAQLTDDGTTLVVN